MTSHHLIEIDDAAWRIGCTTDNGVTRFEPLAVAAPDADPAARAAAARTQLAAMGHVDQPIMLAVPSAWCLCARINTHDMEHGRGRQRAIGYRLEEHLPISAEQMIADYVDLGDGEAMGVCAEYDKLRAIVEALETAGVPVHHICPAAMLTAAFAAAAHPQLDAVLIGRTGGSGYDWIQLEQGRAATWAWLADDSGSVGERLAQIVAQRDDQLELAIIGRKPQELDSPQIAPRLRCVSLDAGGPDEAMALQASRILDEQATAWIDFRRDQLAAADQYERYRRSLMGLACAVALLLVCIIGASQWRAMRYAQQRDQLHAQQVEVYKQAMPGQRVPVNVRGRLHSEQQKLAGLGGAGADQAVRPVSALMHLHRVLAALPVDVPFRILDLSVEPDLIRVDGQAAGHVQAEQLIAQLRQSGAYEVDTPKTQSLKDQGVSFLFTARPVVGADSKGHTP